MSYQADDKMSEKALKPRIRFKGFTEAWEQRKLCELGHIETGNTPSTQISEYYTDTADGLLWVTPSDIDEGVLTETGKKLSSLGASVGRVIPANSILCTCIASIGKNAFLPVKCAFNQQINALTPFFERHYPYFLYTNSYHWSQSMKKEAGGLTFQIVNKTEFSNIETKVPRTIEEETAIGVFFQSIDNLITLHQRKCDKLKVIKKALLEKMFPAEGETTPKIRFKGFTEAWEQRKFEDIFNYERPDAYIVVDDKYDDSYPTPVLTANKGFILGYTYETRTCDKPCIIFDDFTLDSKYVDFKFMVKSSAMKILTAKNDTNLLFAYERLNSTKLESLGHARHYISVVQPTETAMPTCEEQRRIGLFFREIYRVEGHL